MFPQAQLIATHMEVATAYSTTQEIQNDPRMKVSFTVGDPEGGADACRRGNDRIKTIVSPQI
jgi:hypothetical protein